MLVDTPGIFAPRRRLDRAMVAAAWDGAQDADVIALVVDAKAGLRDQVEATLDSHAKRSGVTSLVLKHVDLTTRETRPPLQNHSTHTTGCRANLKVSDPPRH